VRVSEFIAYQARALLYCLGDLPIMTIQSHNFWEFSLAVYSHKAVERACLTLQNSHGLDVNLLLFCYWSGCVHGKLNHEVFDSARAFSAQWREMVVAPLRQIRTEMKNETQELFTDFQAQYENLRERIKFDELAAEKLQQEKLQNLLNPAIAHQDATIASAAINHNLALLLSAEKIVQDARLDALLSIIEEKALQEV